MKSRTSFFNKTVFKKNLTRFAPVMILYTLCLILGIAMMYAQSITRYSNYSNVNFWFASYMCQCIQAMSLVNLFLAPLLAMLLFGDLFNSRMCNALHAMPMRRETLFLTNVVSGLTFSALPTAVMALLSIPLLNGTCIVNAWQIAILWFIGTNLEFICFFGIAVFSVFCAGSRFAMAAVYAALNGGAYVIFFLVNTFYTPMLYGVVTPDRLAILLTPIANMLDDVFVEVQNFNEVTKLFYGRESEMVANFWVNESFYNLIAYAVAGVVFAAAALLIYRKRDLECAGDAVAIRALKPIFQIACAVGAAALASMFLQMFFGYRFRNGSAILYLFLVSGLAVGWFAGKMLLERTLQVFRPKNWLGLVLLTAVAAASLLATHFDVFGIETWVPKAEDVAAVRFGLYGCDTELTEKEDIEKIILLQEMALEDRLENAGGFPLSYIQSRPEGIKGITMPSEGFDYYGAVGYDSEEEHLYAAPIYIEYEMESGRIVTRDYNIWASLEEGDIANEFLSDWDVVWDSARRGWDDEFDINRVHEIRVYGASVPEELVTTEFAQALMDAIKADCEAGNMTPSSYFHHGYFRIYDEEQEEYRKGRSMYITIRTYTGDAYEYTGADFDVFADSENTLNFLRQYDLLPYEVCQENGYGG